MQKVQRLRSSVKGQFGFESVLDVGMIIIILIMIAGAGAWSLGLFDAMAVTTETVTNETYTVNLSSTDFEVVTVNAASDGNFIDYVNSSVEGFDPFSTGVFVERGTNFSLVGTEQINITDYYESDVSADHTIGFDYDWEQDDPHVNQIVAAGTTSLENLTQTTNIMIAVVVLLLIVVVYSLFRGRGTASVV